ncbi:MAG: tRNA lysidine(34) synthetase TilS [Alphaproteobacteria bacterium]
MPLNQNQFLKYLQKNLSPKQKILVAVSCGIDSTVLYDLIHKSQFFNLKNIFYIFFDHQKRVEGKYEIEKFINYYGLNKKNTFIKKLKLGKNETSFQSKARTARYHYILKLSKLLGTDEVFLGHHLDDFKESYFLRKIQSSNVLGLSNVFNEKFEKLNIHRPLVTYSKKQIKVYARKNNLIWFEDRSNFELDYTRNKVRSYLSSNSKISQSIKKDMSNYQDMKYLINFYSTYFQRISKKRFEIKVQEFRHLNKTLQTIAVQSLYYGLRLSLKKQPRNENINNFVEAVLGSNHKIRVKKSVFGGNIGFFGKKLCLNLI